MGGSQPSTGWGRFQRRSGRSGLSRSYANRVTTLHVLPQMAIVMTNDQIVQFILPLFIKALKDCVPNVRFQACRTIQKMMMESEKYNNFAQHASQVLKGPLEDLRHDSDLNR